MKKIIKEVVASRNLMHLATVDKEGFPANRGVDYAMGDVENEVYFITHKMSAKVDQIRNNNRISFVIDEDTPEWEKLAKLKYIKGSGRAYFVKEAEEVQKAFGLLIQKFPFLKDLPGDPSDFLPIKVVFNKVYATDNSVSFGHTEEVVYS